MEALGREMIAWCRGIPLAVLVLRGVLVTKGSLREWERFYEDRNRGGELYERFKGEVREELLFSYVELPYQLKTCFLYLANFSEDEEIDVDDLYMLWDGEGLISSKDREAGETNIDVAKRYLGELVGRSMVEAELVEVHPNGRRSFESCRLHDLMRELCLSIIEKENFLKFNDYRSQYRDKVVVMSSSSLTNGTKMAPRQTLYFSWELNFVVDDKQKANRHVRSLRLIKGRANGISNLKKLDSLRVLTISDTIVGKVQFINELIHLRYLKLLFYLGGNFFSSIDKLVYLQTLNLHRRGLNKPIIIPDVLLMKLKRLRYLFLPMRGCPYEVTPKNSRLRMDGLTELETLVNLNSVTCEMKDVIQLTNLKRFECEIHIGSEDDGKVWKEVMDKLNLGPTGNLLLRLNLINQETEMHSDILNGQLCDHWKGSLYELQICRVRGKFLPEFSNYSLLTKLELCEFEVEEDPMPTLEKLPNLISLFLYRGELKGKEMACSAIGFPKLEQLQFERVKKWEKWRVEQGAMPNLTYLLIYRCMELGKLPEGLKFITSLKRLYIDTMSEEFTRRLSGGEEEEGPDFHIIRHVPELTIFKAGSLWLNT